MTDCRKPMNLHILCFQQLGFVRRNSVWASERSNFDAGFTSRAYSIGYTVSEISTYTTHKLLPTCGDKVSMHICCFMFIF